MLHMTHSTMFNTLQNVSKLAMSLESCKNSVNGIDVHTTI